MGFCEAIDDDVHEGAVSDQVGREFVEIGGQDMNLFLNDGSSGDILFLCRMPGGDDVAVAQVKSGSADENLSRCVGGALILRVFENADGRELGAVKGCGCDLGLRRRCETKQGKREQAQSPVA